MFTQKFLISVLVIGFCTIPASASLVECTTTSCFTTATTGDTFSNISVTQGSLVGDSYTDLGVDFSDTAGVNLVTSLGGSWPAGGAIVANAGVNTMTVALPSSVNAIDFYAGAQDYSYFTISATDNSGGTYTNGGFVGTTTSGVFFGVTTDSTFTSLTITSQASVDKLTLDDISIGSPAAGGDPAPTPEVATLLLVLTGLVLMRAGRRWMPRRVSSSQAPRRGTVRTMSTGITPA